METKKLLKQRRKVKKRKPKFLRKDSKKISKIGKKRKKKQKWRRPRGRDNKIREKQGGYSRQPSIGWGSPKKIKGFIGETLIKKVSSIEELKRIKDGEKIILAKLGKKKKIEIIKKALEKKIKILNIKTEKYIKK
ncbi:MAG: 50S ribosomal protein L32e [archaeon]|nr:MAG: 50S ribosomal protein L32e [archaeon]